jgi:hypothetical protein
MASSSKGATRFWPGFNLNWLSRAAGPTSARDRAFQEYIAGIGMIQVNEQRRKENQPPFQYATILYCDIQGALFAEHRTDAIT